MVTAPIPSRTIEEHLRPAPPAPRGPRHLGEDLRQLVRGLLDPRSLVNGYKRHDNPVRAMVRGPHPDGTPCLIDGGFCSGCANGARQGRLKAVRRTFNLRTNAGIDAQAAAMGGMFSNATAAHYKGTSTSMSATVLTDTGATWTTNEFVGFILVVGSVYGVVASNTGTTITVDKWHDPASGDATGSTPGATTAYFVVGAGFAPAHYIALTNDSGAPAAGDTTLTSEIAANGLSRALGTYAHTASATSYTVTKQFSATGTQAAQKCGMFNALSGGTMWFENTFTSISLVSGDTVTLTWTVNI